MILFLVLVYFKFRLVVVVEISFKDIFISSSGYHFIQRSRMVYAMLVEGIMRNISVKLF